MKSAIFAAGAAVVLAFCAGALSVPTAAAQSGAAAGQAVAFDRSKGNCLACHTMKGSDVPSNVGPGLSDMKARFPKPADLFAVIYDEETRNPQTVMPPFGKNHILTNQEINDIIDFLYTL
jgi:sulfur-oxidizing protein SoxX